MSERSLCLVIVAATVAGCTFDTRNSTLADARPIDAAIDAKAPPPPHLLLSEIKTSNDARLREFIEIVNPSSETVQLSEYYLADNDLYARLPAIAAGEPAAVADEDFIARFPLGSELEPNGVIVIAIRTSDAQPFSGASFAVLPGDNTPPLIPAFSGSIGSAPALDNDAGEGIALFRWNGETDLVIDVDLFNGGFQIAPNNALANKTGLTVDGPDPDLDTSSYADDAYTMPQPARSNGINEAFVRVGGEIDEVTLGGNGVEGHDETTENIRSSWGFGPDSPGTTDLEF